MVRNYLLTSFKVNCFFPVTTGSLPVLIVFTRALHLRSFSPDIAYRLLQNKLHYGNYFICFKSYSFDILNYLCCWKSLKNIAESKNFELNTMVCDPAVAFIISSINRMCIMQRNVLRIICFLKFNNHTIQLFYKMKLMKFVDLVSVENCIFINRCFFLKFLLFT